MNNRRTLAVVTLVIAVVASGIYAFKYENSALKKSNAHAPKSNTTLISSRDRLTGAFHNVLSVSVDSQRLSGIATRELLLSYHIKRIKAFGQVLNLHDLTALITGYATAEAAARKSIYKLEISRNEYVRAKLLFNSTKYVSLEKLQDARAQYYSDLADSESAFEEVSGLKGQLTQEWGRTIARRVMTDSPFVRNLLGNEISLILITVPAGVRPDIAPGTATIVGLNGVIVHAHFISISPMSSPQLQGVGYFYGVRTSSALPAGTNVVAYLPEGKKMSGVMVPTSAVVWKSGAAWIFLKTGRTTFVRRELSQAASTEGGWFVAEGIKPGDKIVVNGAQLLLSQEFKGETTGDND